MLGVTHCYLYKKVTRQQIYGMPTGSVIAWFGLSYPRIFLFSAANIMLFGRICNFFSKFLSKSSNFVDLLLRNKGGTV